jgi:hypothetical protein
MEISEQVDSMMGRARDATSKEFKRVFEYFMLFNTLYQNPKAFKIIEDYVRSKENTLEQDSADELLRTTINSVNRLFYYCNTFQDLQFLMLSYLIQAIPVNIWMFGSTMPETSPILNTLVQINSLGLITIEGQPGICTDDSRQREYLSGIYPKKNISGFIRELQKYPIYVDLQKGFLDDEGEIHLQSGGFYVQDDVVTDNDESFIDFMNQENKAYRELNLGYDYDLFNPETMSITLTAENYPENGWQIFTKAHFPSNDNFTILQDECNPKFTSWMLENTLLVLFIKRKECEMDMLDMILQALQDSLLYSDDDDKPKKSKQKPKKKKK